MRYEVTLEDRRLRVDLGHDGRFTVVLNWASGLK